MKSLPCLASRIRIARTTSMVVSMWSSLGSVSYYTSCFNYIFLPNNSCKLCDLRDVKSVKCPDRPPYLTFLVWNAVQLIGESCVVEFIL